MADRGARQPSAETTGEAYRDDNNQPVNVERSVTPWSVWRGRCVTSGTGRRPMPMDRLRAGGEATSALLREVLEALCQRDGQSLDSEVDPGTPARNYELAIRLGIGQVFGV